MRITISQSNLLSSSIPDKLSYVVYLVYKLVVYTIIAYPENQPKLALIFSISDNTSHYLLVVLISLS